MRRPQSLQEVKVRSHILHIDQLRKLIEQDMDLGIRRDLHITVQEVIDISKTAEVVAETPALSK